MILGKTEISVVCPIKIPLQVMLTKTIKAFEGNLTIINYFDSNK